MLVLGAHDKDGKSTGDKANIGKLKVNRGYPSLITNQIVWKINLDLQFIKFHWGSTILGVSTLCCDMKQDNQ